MKIKRIKIQDVTPGTKVYYYSYIGEYDNSEPEAATITSGPMEICGTICCFIDIRNSVVCIDNLSFDNVSKRTIYRLKLIAKQRYSMWNDSDGVYDGISFKDFLKYKMYKED